MSLLIGKLTIDELLLLLIICGGIEGALESTTDLVTYIRGRDNTLP